MREILFATGNTMKIRDASSVCISYGIKTIPVEIEIDEIQHHDPEKVTEAKARAAYAAVKRPIVVNDSHWAIAALRGFPGAYMKDVIAWFEPEDFIALMSNKTDRRITLTEVVGYYDGQEYRQFVARRDGIVLDIPRGESPVSMNCVVVMNGENGKSIAEILTETDQGIREPLAENNLHWKHFAEWYQREGVQ